MDYKLERWSSKSWPRICDVQGDDSFDEGGFPLVILCIIHSKSLIQLYTTENYREAVLACYKYLNLLRTSSFTSRYQEEIQTLSALRFRFAEKRRPDSYATWVSEHLSHPIPRSLVLSGPQLTWDWDEKLVHEMLAGLNVETGRVVVMAKDHSVVGKSTETVWQKEPWYGTEYAVDTMDAEFMEAARQPNDIPELFLPGPNEFIPINVEVKKTDVSQVC